MEEYIVVKEMSQQMENYINKKRKLTAIYGSISFLLGNGQKLKHTLTLYKYMS